MQLYAVAIGSSDVVAPELASALAAAGAAFACPLEPVVTGASPSGRVIWARIAPPDHVAVPRRYAASADGVVVLFDGFPIERHGRFAAHDSRVLLDNWPAAREALEGVFSAVRIDEASDEVEVVLDVLGLAPVFVAHTPTHTLVANSVRVLRDVAGLTAADPLGIASLVALGWPMDARTLLRDVAFLSGGGTHRFGPGGATFDARVTPRSVLARRSARDPVSPALMRTVRAAVATGVPLTCALTGGRDTRALLALLHGAQADGRTAFYTSGTPADLDVVLAQRLAARYGLEHEVRPQEPVGDPELWRMRTVAYLDRADGLSSLESISDDIDHDRDVAPLPLELWGAGGEIGRKNKRVMESLAAVPPGVRSSYAGQRRMLRRNMTDGGGLVRPEVLAEVGAWLDGFVADRAAEGWPAADMVDLLHGFCRVRHWAGRGVRRAAGSADLYGPLVSQDYVEHALGMTPGERFVERAHHEIVHTLLPDADAEPYEFAWQPQRPRAALALMVREAGRRRRLARRGRPVESVHPPSLGEQWFEAGLDAHRELAERESPVWGVIDQARYRALLDATPGERVPYRAALCRVLTALWWLQGTG